MAWLRTRIASENDLGAAQAAPNHSPIELVVEPGAEALRVKIDAALLGRALHNLFANAWNHGHPKDKPLEVTATIAGGRARVAVRDRGPGFSEAVLPRAFEPFVMGADSARSPGAHGMGLGLALVRRIVEAHGGAASAVNVVSGGGAEVSVELPLATSATP